MNKLIILLCCLFPLQLLATTSDSLYIAPRYNILQELKQPGKDGGEVKLTCSPAINNLLNLHVKVNEKHKSFSGYRIQIYSTSSFGANVNDLKKMRDNFEIAFPDIPAYLNYFDPDFKIRVGNFHSRLECIPALHRIKKQYPSSYPVKTDIKIDELSRIPMQDIPETEDNSTL